MMTHTATPWGRVRRHDQILGADGRVWDVVDVHWDNGRPEVVTVVAQRAGEPLLSLIKPAAGLAHVVAIDETAMHEAMRAAGLAEHVTSLREGAGPWLCPPHLGRHAREHLRDLHGMTAKQLHGLDDEALQRNHDMLHALDATVATAHAHGDHPAFGGA